MNMSCCAIDAPLQPQQMFPKNLALGLPYLWEKLCCNHLHWYKSIPRTAAVNESSDSKDFGVSCLTLIFA